MSPDDSINLERLATSVEKIASALTDWVTLERERLAKEFPPERQRRAAEVNVRDKDRREQLSDKATPEWIEETEEALPQSRFRKRFDDQQSAKGKLAKKTASGSKIV